MKILFTFLTIIIVSFFLPQIALSQTTYTWANPLSGGAWNNASNWNPGTGFPGNGDNAIINSSSPITITNVPSISVNSIEIGGAGTADSVILTSSSAATLTVVNDVTVDSGGIFIGSNLILNFISCSSYNHKMDGGAIPFATWSNNSNCNVTGIVSNQPRNMNQTFYNFLWDCPNQTAVIFFLNNANNFHNFPTGINGTCEFRRIGAGTQCNLDPPNGTTWAGDLIVSANKVLFLTSYSQNAAITFTVRDVYVNNKYGNLSKLVMDNESSTSNYFTFNIRNLSVDGGLFDFNGIYQNNTNVNVSGNLTLTAGSIYNSYDLTAGTSALNFTGTSQQDINITGGTVSGLRSSGNPTRTLTFTAQSGSIINFVNEFKCGAGATDVKFVAAAGSTLMIPDANGITSGAGATTGSVQMPATGGATTFNSTANYTYNGVLPQVTGSGLPGIVNNFTVNNISGIVSGVTLTNNFSVNGTLSLENGNITLGSKSVTILNPANFSGNFSSSNMIIADGTGQLNRTILAGAGSYIFPIGDAGPNYSPVTLNFLTNNTQGNVGMRVTNSAEPNNNSPSAPSSYLSRYWTLTNSVLTSYTYNAGFIYPASNVTGNVSEIKFSKWTGASWFEDDNGSSASSSTLNITDIQDQSTSALTGDFTGRAQASSSCGAPALTAMANGTTTLINICTGGAAATISLTANPSSGSGCTGNFEYSWSNGANYWNGSSFSSVAPVFNSSYNNISFSASVSANYTVSGRCSANTICMSSSIVTVNFPSSVTPSITIVTQFPVINSGRVVTFKATAVNGGDSPSYQWKKNGTNVGINSPSYTDSLLQDNDVITCVLTSGTACATSNTATSNGITITVFEKLVPAVTISASQTNICAGTPVIFTAVATNGGNLPVYQWRKNGANVGSNSSTYKDSTLNNNDVVYCVLTSNANCLAANTGTSNTITITTGATVIPSVSISASADSICFGTAVIFTATPSNGGINPTYQWQKNGIAVGSNSAVYKDSSLTGNDKIKCFLTSSSSCALPDTTTSGSISIKVHPLVTPVVNITSSSTNICSGTTVSFTATQQNGGGGPVFGWQKDGAPVGTNSANYTDPNLADGDVITCILTSNSSCLSIPYDTSNSIHLSVSPQVHAGTVSATKDSICENSITRLTISGGSGNIQWQSSLNGSGFGNLTGVTSASFNTTPLAQTTYFRVYVTNGVCSDSSISLKIAVLPSPVALFTDTANGFLVDFNSSGSSGATSYLWDFGDSTGLSSSPNPSHTYRQPGTYHICLTVKNNTNCNSTLCQNETVDTGTGTTNILRAISWQVYPDPFTNMLYIKNNEGNDNLTGIELYDVTGRILLTEKLLGSVISPFEFNVGNLVEGIYYLKLRTGSGEFIQPVIKQ